MVTQEVPIVNRLGLHARAAAKFVNLAARFESDVQLKRGNQQVNGKSIMGVMMLAAARGMTITITASGSDEEDAVRYLTELVADRFGEEE
ncbi:MAG: phosphocarrier protein HPr [Chromatiales bacterium 21-64-14]|nr:MAG: phosphocarrier protein HPr [Chromatiales bacterium 21-64-14]HQU14952.1 HPr family phosphocarrier protein [Gammaproteobacteria bacterium]